jgi:hypothetical protein
MSSGFLLFLARRYLHRTKGFRGRWLKQANLAHWEVHSALYVLKGEMFLRISVGSAGQESARMEKSKALARAALKHLRLVE